VRKGILRRFSFLRTLAASFTSTRGPGLSQFTTANRPSLPPLRAVLAAILLTFALAPHAATQDLNLQIPPVKIPITIKDQTVTITASAKLSQVSKARDLNILNLQLRADLDDLQQNSTALLSEQLDKDNPCGDRITIQNATLAPAVPAAVATVQLHYERWVCAKLFGKQQVKRIIGGNATLQLKLTPAVDENKTAVHLVPELGSITADGSLGELLRSGDIAAMLRDKIQTAIQSALQKADNLGATLPPAAQPYATIENAAFQDAGSGRLALVLDGQLRLTKDQLQQLTKEIKDRVAKR